MRKASFTCFSFCVQAFLILALSCSSSKDYVIVPGEKIGDYRIDKTQKQDIGGEGIESDTIRTHDGVLCYFSTEGDLIAASTTSPEYHTKKGLRPGSPRDSVILLYGKSLTDGPRNEYGYTQMPYYVYDGMVIYTSN
ncbi:MAG: hypothetical protein ACOCSE_04540, partial [Chitinivibrionales bacterium]